MKYEEYRKTPYWRHLKYTYIYNNKDAHCWICEGTYNLFLHHVRYNMFFKEKLGKSFYIICGDCHDQIHFFRILFYKKKLELKRRNLLIRQRYLRFKYCVLNRKFLLSLYYLFYCLFTI